MTEPSQYFKGRTVQEQMNEVIGYVDVRAEEVAAAKADDVLEPAEQAKDDAIAAKEAAEDARDTTLAALPQIQQDITDLKAEDVALDGRLDNVELRITTAEGNIVTIQGRVTAVENKNTQQDSAIAALQTADANNVKITGTHKIGDYAVLLTGNQGPIAGVKSFSSSIIQLGSASPTIKPGNEEKSTVPASKLTHNMVLVQDDASNNLAGIYSITETDGKRHITAFVFDCDGTYRSQVIL